MATTKKNDLVRITETLSERGRDVWLAGLGALVVAEEESTKLYSNVVERSKQLGEDSADLFNSLVKRGRDMENQGLKRIDETVDDLETQQKRLTNRVEDALENVLERFGVPTRAEVKSLTKKVDTLSKKVDALVTVLEQQPAPAAAPNADTDAVYHVVPHDEGWAVKKEGNTRASSVHSTKNEAVESARATAGDQAPSRLVIHKKDGTIQDTVSYEA